MGEQSSKIGFLALSLAGVLSKVISVFYAPFLNAIIGKEGYGVYQLNYEVFTFAYALTSIGVQTAVAKYVSELLAHGQEKDAMRAFNIARRYFFTIGVSMTAILILLAKPLSVFSEVDGIYYGIIALAPSVSITALLSTYRGYFQGKNKMVPIAISQLIEQFLNVTISLFFAAYLVKFGRDFGAAGGTIGTGLGALAAVLLLIIVFIKNKMDKEARINDVTGITISKKQHVRTLFTYAFPFILSSGIQNLGAMIDGLLINKRLINGAGFTKDVASAAFGYLGKYKQIYYVPLVIITALVTAIIPSIAKAYTLKDRKGIKTNVRISMRITLLITIPCSFGLSTLAYQVYDVLKFESAGAALMTVGAFVTIFMAVVQTQVAILQGTSDFYAVIYSLVIGTLLKVIANYVLVGIPGINITGAIIGGYLCFAIPMIINNRRIRKHLKIKVPLLRLSIKPVISSLFMSLVIIVARIPIYGLSRKLGLSGPITCIPLLILIGIGAIAYFYSLVVLKGITKKDINTISPKVYRVIPTFIKNKIK